MPDLSFAFIEASFPEEGLSFPREALGFGSRGWRGRAWRNGQFGDLGVIGRVR